VITTKITSAIGLLLNFFLLVIEQSNGYATGVFVSKFAGSDKFRPAMICTLQDSKSCALAICNRGFNFALNAEMPLCLERGLDGLPVRALWYPQAA